jgi:hypothetical protein
MDVATRTLRGCVKILALPVAHIFQQQPPHGRVDAARSDGRLAGSTDGVAPLILQSELPDSGTP